MEDSGLGHVGGCADDAGICIRELRSLIPIHDIFDKYRLLSGLTLKPAKSIVILLAKSAFPPLGTHIPDWANMEVINHAYYEGILLGPIAGQGQWKNALKKFRERVSQINAPHLPLPLAGAEYISRAAPVLGYIAQIACPPHEYQHPEL